METFLWVEQYRPKDIGSCVLPNNLKSTLIDFISEGNVPNLILSGTSGVGKTTLLASLTSNTLPYSHEPTIGIDMGTIFTPVSDNKIIKSYYIHIISYWTP